MSPSDSTVIQSAKARKRMIAGAILLLLFIVWPILTILTPAGYLFLKSQWVWYGLWLGLGVGGIVLLAWSLRFEARMVAIVLACGLFGSAELFIVWSQFLERPRIEGSVATTGLGGIFVAATANKKEHKTYEVSDINQLGLYYHAGLNLYSFWYAIDGVPTRIPLPAGASYKPGPCDVLTPPTSVKVTASANGFTAAAKGNRTHLFECDEWSINEKKEFKHTLDETRN